MSILQEFASIRPQGGAKVILADPAWLFENFSDKGEGKNPNAHYDCMPLADIRAMPVKSLAAKDCALFLWVTWPMQKEWQSLLDAWEFDYAGLAWEWIKYNPETEKYAFGPGYGTRKNLEPCLLATRGSPHLRKDFVSDLFGLEREVEGVHSVRDFILEMPLDCIRQPRREHSRKPEEQYKRIETMFDGPYVELFARHQRRGWRTWGNQSEKFGSES